MESVSLAEPLGPAVEVCNRIDFASAGHLVSSESLTCTAERLEVSPFSQYYLHAFKVFTGSKCELWMGCIEFPS